MNEKKRNWKKEKDNKCNASFTYKNGFIFKLSHSKIRKVKNLYDSISLLSHSHYLSCTRSSAYIFIISVVNLIHHRFYYFPSCTIIYVNSYFILFFIFSITLIKKCHAKIDIYEINLPLHIYFDLIIYSFD